MRDPEFYKRQLDTLSGSMLKSADRVFIVCPFHQDTKPSGSVWVGNDKPHLLGRYKCWGCNATKTWNELAIVLHLQQVDNRKSTPDEVPDLNMKNMRRNMLGAQEGDEKEQPPEKFDFFPLQENWRGFKSTFLTKLGAKLAYLDRTGMFYVYLPVLINGVEEGYIKAQQVKPTDGGPSYINKAGPWSRKVGLFPYDYAVELAKKHKIRTIVLTEGPRDAMRLCRDGIPAVCILGTQSWGPGKRRLLETAGFKKVLLVMDGDLDRIKKDKEGKPILDKEGKKIIENPGREAAEKLWADMRLYFDVKIFPTWKYAKEAGEKIDPFSAPAYLIDKIDRHIV